MIKIDKCVAKPTEFSAIKITSELGDEVQKAFKTADKLDKKLDLSLIHISEPTRP